MATLEEQFIKAREHIERICEKAGDSTPAIKGALDAQMDTAEDSLDAIQDLLSEVVEDAATDVGAEGASVSAEGDHHDGQ